MKTDRGLLFGVACALGFAFALGSSELAGCLIQRVEPRFSSLALGIVLAFVVVGIAARKRGLLEASVAALALVPAIAFEASLVLEMPIAPWVPKVVSLVPPVSVPLIAMIALGTAITGVASSWVVRVRTFPLVRIVFRSLALVAVVWSMVVVVLAVRKSRTTIEPDEFRSRIEPVPGNFPDVSSGFQATNDPRLRAPNRKSKTIEADDARLTYEADLTKGRCQIRVEPSGTHGPYGVIDLPSATIEPTPSQAEGLIKNDGQTTTCIGGTVARLPEMHLWIFSRRGLPSNRDIAVVGPPFSRHAATLESFHDDVGPPRAWIAIAIAGIFAAIVAALLGRRDRALEAALSWNEVEVDGKTMLRDPRARDGLYRGPLDPSFHTRVIPGSREELYERIDRTKAARWALALAIVTVTATPLVVAASYGLLSM